jgi:hypothetical protein
LPGCQKHLLVCNIFHMTWVKVEGYCFSGSCGSKPVVKLAL